MVLEVLKHPEVRVLAADIDGKVPLELFPRFRVGLQTQLPERVKVGPLAIGQLREVVVDTRPLRHRHGCEINSETHACSRSRTRTDSRPRSRPSLSTGAGRCGRDYPDRRLTGVGRLFVEGVESGVEVLSVGEESYDVHVVVVDEVVPAARERGDVPAIRAAARRAAMAASKNLAATSSSALAR